MRFARGVFGENQLGQQIIVGRERTGVVDPSLRDLSIPIADPTVDFRAGLAKCTIDFGRRGWWVSRHGGIALESRFYYCPMRRSRENETLKVCPAVYSSPEDRQACKTCPSRSYSPKPAQ